MIVQDLIEHPVDLGTLKDSETFLQWVNKDISNAFYLGFMRREFADEIEKLKDREDGTGLVLLKSIDGILVQVKPYLKEMAGLLKPHLDNSEGFIVLDAVNDVLSKIQPAEEDDIYKIAYTLGTYMDSLYRRNAADA